MSDNAFERYISMLPVDWETLLSTGLSWYLKKQDPEWVDLEYYADGYSIKVKADTDNVEDFVEFWKSNVDPKLGDADE